MENFLIYEILKSKRYMLARFYFKYGVRYLYGCLLCLWLNYLLQYESYKIRMRDARVINEAFQI